MMTMKNPVPDRSLQRRLVPGLLYAMLMLSLPVTAHADDALDAWRKQITATRTLAENDAPASYRDAQRLQSELPANAEAADRARILNLLARIELHLGLIADSAKHSTAAYTLAKQSNDEAGEVESDLNISLAAINQGRLDDMIAATQEGMGLLEHVQRDDLRAEEMFQGAMMYLRFEQLDEAVNVAMQALDVANNSGDPLMRTYAEQGMAMVYEQGGRYAEAREHYQRMQESAREAHSTLLEAAAILGQGAVTLGTGDIDEGMRQIEQAIALFQQVGAPLYVNHARHMLADLYRRNKQPGKALALFDENARSFEQRSNPIGLWWTLQGRSSIFQELGRLQAARRDAERAYGLAQKIGFNVYLAGSAQRLAELSSAQGNMKQAYRWSAEAISLKEKADREKTGKRIIQLANRFREESKQRRIEELIQHNKLQDAQQRWLWTLLGGSLAVLGVSVFFLRSLRRSNRMLETANVQLRQSQEELRVSEQRFREIFNNASDGLSLLEVTPELRFRSIEVNPALARSMGYSREEMLGQFIDEAGPYKDTLQALAQFRRSAEAGTTTHEDIELELPGGRRYFSSSFVPLRDASGRVYHIVAITRDVTERKRMADDLAAREREFRTLAENQPDYLVRYDTACRAVYANPALVKLMGGDPAALIGKTPWEAASGAASMDAYRQALEHTIASGEPGEIEVPIGFPGDKLRYHQVRFFAEQRSNGEIRGALAIGRDVTERKRVEEELARYREHLEELVHKRTAALQESEARLRALIDNLPFEFWAMDNDLRYIMQNATSLGNYGAVVGKSIDELGLPPEIAAGWRAQDGRALAGEIIHAEYERDMGGERRVFESLIAPVVVDECVVGIVGVGMDITERKQMENILRESRQSLAEAQRIAHVGSWEMNLVGNVLTWSDEIYRIFEVDPQGFGASYEAFMEAVHPDDRDMVDSTYKEALEKREPFEIEHRLLLPDGRVKYVHERSETVYGNDGKALRSIGTVQDITELKLAEQQLKRALAFTDQLINAIPDPVFVKDREHRWLRLNDAFCEFIGKQREVLIGKSDYDFFPKEEADEFWEKDELVFSSGLENVNEEAFTDSEGITHSIQTKKVSIVDIDGNNILVGVIRDITERKQLEETLAARESELRALAESSPGMMGSFYQRPDGTVCLPYTSPNIYELFGVRSEEVVRDAAPLMGLNHPDDAQRVRDTIAESARTLTPWHCEFRILHPVKGERWMEGHTNPQPHPDGGTIWYGYLHDVTERKQIDQRLKEALEFSEGVINAIPDLLFELDRDGRCLNVWTHRPELLAAQREMLLGQTVVDMLAPEAAAAVMIALHEAENNGVSFGKSICIELPEGRRWFELSVSRRPGSEAGDVRFLVLSRDVTARKQAEDEVRELNVRLEQRVQDRTARLEKMNRELSESEHRFRTLAENSPSLIVRYGLDCRRIYVNPAYIEETGVDADSALKTAPDAQWAAGMSVQAREYGAALERVMVTGKPAEMYITWRHVKTGKATDYAVQMIAERGPDGRVTGALMLAHNITELKRVEQNLEESRRQLRELAARQESAREDERKHIARELHDDLGQYLTALRLKTSALELEFGAKNPVLGEKLKRMLGLVDDTKLVVRNLSQMLRPAALDMGIASALEWLADEFERHSGIPCELQIPERLSLDENSATVVFRTVQEALTNIVKHAGAGEVFVSLQQQDGAYVLEVRDDGVGFDPALRKDASFGLVGMRERALMLGGELAISSAPGQGTCITLHIPIR